MRRPTKTLPWLPSLRPLLLLVALPAAGCADTPTAGGACNAPAFACADSTSALACEYGGYRTISCGGGCSIRDGVLRCKHAAGEACATTTYACTDEKTIIACQGGRYVAAACDGPAGCTVHDATASCDNSVETEGAACLDFQDGAPACRSDGSGFLKCSAGRWQSDAPCPAGSTCTGTTTLACSSSE